MALLHHAELRPTKLELIADWLPSRDWWPNEARDGLEQVAAYRFDDPAGEVGIESILTRSPGGPVVHVPLTYRAAPLEGYERWLVGTMEHSVLGPRWVYDGCGDPVYVGAVAQVVFAGGTEVEVYFEVDGTRQVRPPTCSVQGSGTRDLRFGPEPTVPVDDGDPTRVSTATLDLAVTRVIEGGGGGAAQAWGEGVEQETLTGTWDGVDGPQVLVAARLR